MILKIVYRKYCVQFICLSSLKLFLFRFFVRGGLNAFTCPQLTGRTHISLAFLSVTLPLFILFSSSSVSSLLWLIQLLQCLPSVCRTIYMTRNSGHICFQIHAFDALFQMNTNNNHFIWCCCGWTAVKQSAIPRSRMMGQQTILRAYKNRTPSEPIKNLCSNLEMIFASTYIAFCWYCRIFPIYSERK